MASIPAFEERLQRWLKNNIELVRINLPPDSADDMMVARTKDTLPIAFNIEAGAYINTIRSSLDILAAAIAKREHVVAPYDTYFPVATSETEFRRGSYKGAKFIKQLSPAARSAFEAAKPYKGGNDALWALHQFDILRKHKRLLTVESAPLKMHVWGFGLSKVWRGGDLRRIGQDETVVGYVTKGEPDPQIEIAPYVVFYEPAVLQRCAIATGLTYFANAAHTIIQRFDY